MKNTESKINGTYIVLGLLFLAFYVYPMPRPIDENNLAATSATIYRSEMILGRHAFYRLWVNEFKAAFIIEEAGLHDIWREQDSIRPGDSIRVKYWPKRIADLQDKSEEISIYHLEVGHRILLTCAAYNEGLETINRRMGYVALLMGALLFTRGLRIISVRVTWVLAVAGILTIFILRYLGKF